MSKIEDLTTNKAKRAGSGGHWRREDNYDGTVSIWHYSTLMLTYRSPAGSLWGTVELLDCSTGNGSVSDQHGMNKIFHALNLPYYYSRRGGATIARVGS